ncbi:hypothetical protein ACFYNO_25995 [Kitasatospora sp. NPDC006697]|uniref:hypothetical protein n=1 Tax=Kitasatospora sp. NPDC006697 TaxID=3364020 RepID=UPI0036B31E9D
MTALPDLPALPDQWLLTLRSEGGLLALLNSAFLVTSSPRSGVSTDRSSGNRYGGSQSAGKDLS